MEEGLKLIRAELDYWEKYIKHGGFIVGDSFTAADIGLFPHLAFFARLGATFKDFPNVADWFVRIQARESAKKSTPPHWAESQPSINLKDKL